jgi:diguanylate cyclase (GGDEF)-like protein
MKPQHAATRRGRRLARKWALFRAPRRLLGYLLVLDLAAGTALVLAFANITPSAGAAWRVVLILALAVLFEEVSRTSSRLRTALSEHLKPNMGSVWLVSACLALPLPYALMVVVGFPLYMWFRQQRGTDAKLYLKISSAAILVLACIGARATIDLIARHPGDMRTGVIPALAVVAGLMAFTAVNRGLVTGVLLINGVRGKDLIGPFNDNMVELATLCLGGLTALAVTHQPLLAALVLLPMALLQRGALVQQLEVAATTDAKTGLLNAIAWEHMARRDAALAERDGTPFAVLIIDVDRFKEVNDAHGHLTGDIALKAIGEALVHELRGYDTVGRFGGEEFVACLPNADTAAALRIAERVRVRVNHIRIGELVPSVDIDRDSSLAVSIGVACCPADGTQLTDLLIAADAALYLAKASGRNRVQLARRGSGGTPESVPVPVG